MKKTLQSRLISRRGNAMIEFALSVGILVPLFLGTFQFGYTFYVYNLLNSQIRAGARYASMRAFRCNKTSSITAFKTRVKNMVRFGNPDGSGDLIVPGLDDNELNVQIKDKNDADADSTHLPAYVIVSASTFPVDAIVGTYNFTGKPFLRFPYIGQFSPGEDEP
jgi:Flp pilus assembly protein TadG